MASKAADEGVEDDLFWAELVNLIDQRHELVKLAAFIDWQAFADKWNPQFTSSTGRPTLPTRLMAALLYLKHAFALSDEDVVERWRENPYWQHFSGERYFRHELPCDLSSLVRWRQRIGEEGCATAGADDRGGKDGRPDQAAQPGRDRAGHNGTAQGDCTPDRQPPA